MVRAAFAESFSRVGPKVWVQSCRTDVRSTTHTTDRPRAASAPIAGAELIRAARPISWPRVIRMLPHSRLRDRARRRGQCRVSDVGGAQCGKLPGSSSIETGRYRPRPIYLER